MLIYRSANAAHVHGRGGGTHSRYVVASTPFHTGGSGLYPSGLATMGVPKSCCPNANMVAGAPLLCRGAHHVRERCRADELACDASVGSVGSVETQRVLTYVLRTYRREVPAAFARGHRAAVLLVDVKVCVAVDASGCHKRLVCRLHRKPREKQRGEHGDGTWYSMLG